MRYGIISDIHKDPRIAELAIKVLKDQGAEQIILNGDIGNRQSNIEESQAYVACILNAAVKSGLRTFAQPGSHETIFAYQPVIEHFSRKYPKIIDALKQNKVEQNDHDLVFLAGSDFVCGGEYVLGNDPTLPSHNYLTIAKPKTLIMPDGSERTISVERSMIMFDSLEEAVSTLNGMRKIDPKVSFEMFRYTNMNDLRKLVSSPRKTIAIGHIAGKFTSLDNGIDMANFWQGRVYHRNPSNMQEYMFTELSVMPIVVSKEDIERETGSKVYSLGQASEEEIKAETIRLMEKENVDRWQVFVERKENRGNEALIALYDELGIKKAVNGHFHESGHRACDRLGNPVAVDTFVEELFWNNGHMDLGQTGILTVEGEKVKYHNINLADFL